MPLDGKHFKCISFKAVAPTLFVLLCESSIFSIKWHGYFVINPPFAQHLTTQFRCLSCPVYKFSYTIATVICISPSSLLFCITFSLMGLDVLRVFHFPLSWPVSTHVHSFHIPHISSYFCLPLDLNSVIFISDTLLSTWSSFLPLTCPYHLICLPL